MLVNIQVGVLNEEGNILDDSVSGCGSGNMNITAVWHSVHKLLSGIPTSSAYIPAMSGPTSFEELRSWSGSSSELEELESSSRLTSLFSEELASFLEIFCSQDDTVKYTMLVRQARHNIKYIPQL